LSVPKIILISGFSLFAFIGLISLFKGSKKTEKEPVGQVVEAIQEIQLKNVVKKEPKKEIAVKPAIILEEKEALKEKTEVSAEMPLPEADLIDRLFSTRSSQLPIVETVTYTSRVPWLKGRPAWIADYASHYDTSRHFIARSLNHKQDYFTQKVSSGDRFNVFKKDKNFEFYLLVDLSHSKMWLYYIDLDEDARVLIKTYPVGVGRKEDSKTSGYLTPIGKYTLGEKIAIYKPGTVGFFQDQKTEMVRVFGTRWIPFEKEISGCSDGPKGYGIHGAPWVLDRSTGKLVEDRDHVGKYDSDGCIRLYSEDIEEIFSIVITKPATIEIVKGFHDAKLPGEKEICLEEIEK